MSDGRSRWGRFPNAAIAEATAKRAARLTPEIIALLEHVGSPLETRDDLKRRAARLMGQMRGTTGMPDDDDDDDDEGCPTCEDGSYMGRHCIDCGRDTKATT